MIERSIRGPVEVLRLAHGKASAMTLATIPPPSFALRKRHIRQPVRDLLDAHEASIDAEVIRVWTNPATRDAVRRFVDRALGART